MSSAKKPLSLPAVIAVAGVSFHVASRDVRLGETLEVRLEAENPYDPEACVVLRSGEVVGHVPKCLSERLRATGDGSWSAEVVELLPGPTATGIRLRVFPGRPALPWRASSAGVAGERSPEDGEHAADSSPSEHVDPDATRPKVVRARSGRVLGIYVSSSSGATTVLTETGDQVRYPSDLVAVEG